jgi:BirA family biotin operon repressor/biotin-[acetyl-CoA-carboxylase] ligase
MRHIHLDNCNSTQDYLKEQLAQGVETDLLISCENQTQGHGRNQKKWETLPHSLYFSFNLEPNPKVTWTAIELSVIIADYFYEKFGESLKLKWPNDIYVGDKKLGGILIENSIMSGTIKSSIVGVGLNINQTDFKSNAPNPVSLKMLTNKHCESEGILQDILAEVSRYYDLLCLGDFEKIDREFLSALYRLNERHYFKSNVIFEGEIVGVDPIGKLLIKKDDGRISEFYFKEVEFLQKQ